MVPSTIAARPEIAASPAEFHARELLGSTFRFRPRVCPQTQMAPTTPNTPTRSMKANTWGRKVPYQGKSVVGL
jgi:hypothetical protein